MIIRQALKSGEILELDGSFESCFLYKKIILKISLYTVVSNRPHLIPHMRFKPPNNFRYMRYTKLSNLIGIDMGPIMYSMNARITYVRSSSATYGGRFSKVSFNHFIFMRYCNIISNILRQSTSWLNFEWVVIGLPSIESTGGSATHLQ